MQQTFSSPEEQNIHPLQKSLLVGFAGLLLAATQLAGGIFVIYYQVFIALQGGSIPYFFLLLVFSAFFYFLLPIPVCFYVAYRTRQSHYGRRAGESIGCTGAILSVLSGLIVLYTGIAHDLTGLGSYGFILFVVFAFINFLGFWLTPLGAGVGSMMGIAFRKRQGI